MPWWAVVALIPTLIAVAAVTLQFMARDPGAPIALRNSLLGCAIIWAAMAGLGAAIG